MAKRFRVVTDSTSDVPEVWRERWGIEIVPLRVLFGTEALRDGVDLTTSQFFDRLRQVDRLPTTSAPTPADFAAVYERLSHECDGVISIHIGSNLSATVEMARMGASSVDGFPVHVVDSRCVTLCVAQLCRVAAESADLEEAVRRVEQRVPRQRILTVLDTLRYAEMGGRVNRAQAMIGTVLNVKPILRMMDGEIRLIDRVRTRGRAIPRLLELFRADLPVEHLAVSHGQAHEDAERIRAELARELPGVDVALGEIGAVLGTHVGPGAVGLTYIKAE